MPLDISSPFMRRTPFFPTEDTKKEKITTMAIFKAKWYKRFRDF
jgi:hypothetical protein